MELILGTFLFSIGSALLPFLNVELYLGGVGITGAGPGALGLASVAACGQLVGKIVWYEVARRGVDSEWAQKKLRRPQVRASYERWSERLAGRPWFAGGIIFSAASVGIPPLLVMAAVAGALRVPLWVFVPTVLIGRTLRFWAILAGVESIFV